MSDWMKGFEFEKLTNQSLILGAKIFMTSKTWDNSFPAHYFTLLIRTYSTDIVHHF